MQGTLCGLVDRLIKIHTGGTNQLGDNNTFRAIDNERSLVRHHREVADEYGLRFNFTSIVVHELRCHIQRSRVVNVFFFALINGVLHLFEAGLRQR